ncbi:hypothetical protein [Paraburkholderia sp.]
MSDEQQVVDTPQSGTAAVSPQSATPSSQPAGEGTQSDVKKEGDGAGNEKKKEGKKLEDLVSLAWKGLLFLGGIFLLIFFADVGFFPTLKLTDLTATLAAVSLTGLLMLVIFAGSFVAPALMAHGSFARLNKTPLVVWMSALAGAVPAWTLCLWLFLWGAPGVAGGGLCLSLALVFATIAYRNYLSEKRKLASVDVAGNDGAAPGGQSVLRVGTKLDQFGGPLMEVLGVASTFFVGQLIATYYGILLYHSPASRDQNLWLAVWPAICFVANIGLLSIHRADEKRWWKDLGLMAGALLVIFLAMTGASSQISGGIARRFALGGIPDAVVTLSKQGCKIAEASSCGAMTCQYATPDALGVVRKVKIVSRIGSEVVLQPDQSKVQVVMKSTEVLGWAREAPPSSPRAASGVAGNDSNQERTEILHGLDCSAASAAPAASSPAPASSPNPASVPQPASSSAVALSAVALAELKTTVQNTIEQTMTARRHSVPVRARAPAAPAATNVFYDNHGEVTVNNLATERGAGDALRVNAREGTDCAPGSACATPRAATIDRLTTRTTTSVSTTSSAAASATLGAAAGVSR